MNNNQQNNRYNSGNDQDAYIDRNTFERRKRAAEIIENEEIERQKRRREQIRCRNAERMRQAKIARLKGYCLLGITALGALFIFIGIITAIVKVASAGKNKAVDDVDMYAITAEETALISDFNAYSSLFYTGNENSFFKSANSMVNEIALNGATATIPAVSKRISEYGALSERYIYMRNDDNYAAFREAVKNTPIFSNGYIWSETDSMKSSVSGGYLYDTNTSFITAVANICILEGNTSFLSEVDNDTQPKKDSSQGLTVSKKLEMAINYLFDNDTLGGGIKYDAQYTSLCYIHTAENNGSSTGTPSNRWTNFKFGYLDAYCNISFNKAMRALVKLYNLQGLTDEAGKYKAVADNNAAAFSDKFWDSEKKRFVGCFDKNSVFYDYGFTFINIEAIEAGMAKKEQISDIYSWLDGTREIPTDTSKGSDIYALGFAPRNTTLAADDKLWDTLGGSVILSGNGKFGDYYLNGGASLSSAYYDILARNSSGLKDTVTAKLNALIKEYNQTGFTTNDGSSKFDIAENPLSGLAPIAVVKTVFGIENDGLHLTVNPNLALVPSETEAKLTSADLGNKYGIKNVRFGTNTYGFLYADGKFFATSEKYSAIRLNAGGFEKNGEYKLFKVINGSISGEPVSLTADENGIIGIITDFGAETYIKVEKAEKTEKAK